VAARLPLPREMVAAACATYGRAEVVTRCASMALGEIVDVTFLRVLVGQSANTVLQGLEGGLVGYWPRVWGMRALLYVFDQSAVPAIVASTRDDSWRVREMAAKVIRRNGVDEALDDMVRLSDDDVPRVRVAAARALRALSE
jgi:hypothetical protein